LSDEFSLSIGQKAVIEGEDLEITFKEVLEDSRCPTGVECIWEGRVRCLIEIKSGDLTDEIELIESGHNDLTTEFIYDKYLFVFHVLPYPVKEIDIEKSEYRLKMTVNTFGIIEGTVTIGPISPVEIEGETSDIPCEVYEARKIMIYNKAGNELVLQVDIDCEGKYRAELKPGIYTVDINNIGIDRSEEVPVKIEIKTGEIVTLDIDIDTGIR
jgi:hypothetical protein